MRIKMSGRDKGRINDKGIEIERYGNNDKGD